MAWLGALAFALQLLLPLVHAPPVAAAIAEAESRSPAAHGGHHDGHRPNEAPAPIQAPGKHAGGHECPLCNIVKILGALPPSGALLLRLSAETGPVRAPLSVDAGEGFDHYRQANPRAPPIPA